KISKMITMHQLVDEFPNQLRRAIEIGQKAKIGKPKFPIRNVLITGLGGSGIGGTIISNILRDDLQVPVVINKEYRIPAFVNENTLVIVSSYSGNTEETLSAMMQAFKKDAQIVCITSGGLVKEYADTNDFDYVLIDGGAPPRAAFGQSFVQIFFILHYLGLLQNDFINYLEKSIALLEEDKADIKKVAYDIASKLNGKIPVIYSDAKYEGVAVRFRQQINENSKMLCWHHVIPEMNHNELVGWREKNENIAVVFLKNAQDYERNQERMEFVKTVVSQYASTTIEIESKGEKDIERVLFLIHLTDWVSCYLADLKGVDAIEVDVISQLKNKLAENPII
ncbi:MAG TPA: bifunctional phosphoglucose/phosphomannose isomerase, partial [Chitinophagales bacterium]|nr:bifunctional phosphoglucose/phosphomannose isomerase [Chitinophagales bacterium]HNL17547.1 bifunctional phosphoglucose/phosphomannose isomerase [Chitinophagales bacterium]